MKWADAVCLCKLSVPMGGANATALPAVFKHVNWISFAFVLTCPKSTFDVIVQARWVRQNSTKITIEQVNCRLKREWETETF